MTIGENAGAVIGIDVADHIKDKCRQLLIRTAPELVTVGGRWGYHPKSIEAGGENFIPDLLQSLCTHIAQAGEFPCCFLADLFNGVDIRPLEDIVGSGRQIEFFNIRGFPSLHRRLGLRARFHS